MCVEVRYIKANLEGPRERGRPVRIGVLGSGREVRAPMALEYLLRSARMELQGAVGVLLTL